MQIEEIEIKNYRLFRDVHMKDLSNLVIVVGANGCGKSTLFDVFSFLKDALTQNVAVAVARRGGFKELVSRGQDGPISITVKFRENSGRLATYQLEIGIDEGHAVVEKESFTVRLSSRGRTLQLMEFNQGQGFAVTNEETLGKKGAEPKTQAFRLQDPSVLALKGLGQFQEFPMVTEFRGLIEKWHLSHIPLGVARESAEDRWDEHLSSAGDNLPQVTRYLFEQHPKVFQTILDGMRRNVPGIRTVEAYPMVDGRIVLRFQEKAFKEPFLGRFVSDGTMKMFAYLVLLNDPHPHPLLAIEEPENFLYPELMRSLIEEFREYARRGGQVFVSTHSPEFLNGASLEEIYYLKKENGFSTAHKLSDSPLLRSLVEAGDYPGTLWLQGLLAEVVRL